MKATTPMRALDSLRENAVPARGTPMSTEQAMRLAISQAYLGAMRVSPNPMVGCVVLDSEGNFLSCGHHEFFGGPHAEVNALQKLQDFEIKDGHLLVTLEPCAHEGKTPSCAKMLAKTPLKKITYGLIDPNPLVAGQGAEILRLAGKDVQAMPNLQLELQEVCEIFLKNYLKREPFVSLKVASTLDGKTSERNGTSKWITNSKSREYVHYLRASHDAVMAGAKTVLCDNSKLNIRSPLFEKTNQVIVLDRRAEVLRKRNELDLFKHHRADRIYIFLSKKYHDDFLKIELEDHFRGPKGLNIFWCDESQGHLDFAQVLKILWEQNIKSIFVESGGRLASALLSENHVDRLHLFLSNQILGQGIGWTDALPNEKLSSSFQTESSQYKIFEDNIYLSATIKRSRL